MSKLTPISSFTVLLSIATSVSLFGGCGSNVNVVVNILDLDDASATASDANAMPAVSSTAMASQIAAPNYVAVDHLAMQIDAHNLVTTAGGTLDLSDGTVTGEDYVIDRGTLPSLATFADVDRVYLAGTKVTVGSNPQIEGSRFLSIGDDLTNALVRSAIIHHEVLGVSSYQILTITFRN
jgi:hypothetical protein